MHYGTVGKLLQSPQRDFNYIFSCTLWASVYQVRYKVHLSFLQINNNGLLSFEDSVTSYSAQPFPITASQFEPVTKNIIIAPYWADVDTRTAGSGAVWYRQTANSTLLERARQEVIEIFLLYPEIDGETYNPTTLIIATWDKVGFYNRKFDKV